MHEMQEVIQNDTTDRHGQIKVLYPDSLNLFGCRMRTKWNFEP